MSIYYKFLIFGGILRAHIKCEMAHMNYECLLTVSIPSLLSTAVHVLVD